MTATALLRPLLRPLLLSVLTALTACTATEGPQPGFTLWQLPPQGPSQMNSYVLRTDAGRVAVVDGGTADDAPYLRGFLAATGNRVEVWFITHPHADHMGALAEILKAPGGLEIGMICHSPMTAEQLATDGDRRRSAEAFYEAIESSEIPKRVLTEPGMEQVIDGLHIKVLQVNDRTTLVNAYNNASVVLRLWDSCKSVVLLGDAGEEAGDRLLAGVRREELDCDYLQLAHHGQMGVRDDFYRAVKFRACLWPTPLWLWNNDVGGGYDTAWMKTPHTRALMDALGIEEHYCAWQGVVRIE